MQSLLANSASDAVSLDNIDDDLKQLEAETQIDNSFQDFLAWVQSQEEDPFYQLPKDWLKQ